MTVKKMNFELLNHIKFRNLYTFDYSKKQMSKKSFLLMSICHRNKHFNVENRSRLVDFSPQAYEQVGGVA